MSSFNTADTNNITLVRNHIVATLRALKWDVEEDLFTDETPYGRKRFTNIIATKDPLAPRRIVVSAHYDSKFFEGSPMNQVDIQLLPYRSITHL
jgi:glutaminyl-peptide cyclotransferase